MPSEIHLGTHHYISGGGGGLEFFLLAIFFVPPRENNLFFWRSTSDNVSSTNFFVVCLPYYVRYHLVFFLVNIFFINFDNKLFLPTFSTNVFSDFCGDKLFFFSILPPPPRYQMVRPLTVTKRVLFTK